MGYQVQAYSLEELQRISAPGAVVPSLFWMLPVGQWWMGELDECWRMFTDPAGGDCHDLGLIPVKEPLVCLRTILALQMQLRLS